MARHIMIVDNSATMRRIIRGMIQANINDAIVSEAYDAKDALQKIEREKCHLILFSWESSGNDWLDFFKHLQKQPREQRLASVLLTSSTEKNYIPRVEEAGVTEHLIIPCPPEVLSGTINRVCNPVSLRHANRYSLPDTAARLEQGPFSYRASVINISSGGLLCELEFTEEFKWWAPVMITVTIPLESEEFVAADLYSTMGRVSVEETHPDRSPKKIRAAFRFFKVPEASARILERVFTLVDEQERLLHS